MEFWIEGSVPQVIQAANYGLADAIATNPAIMERWTASGRSLEDTVADVCDHVDIPVYVQLHGPSVDEYLREMDELRRISALIHPKLVATHAGMSAARRIAADGLKPLITTVATLNQAFLAARAGASYVAPYIGRIQDASVDAYALVSDIAAMYARHGLVTQIAAASIRSAHQAEHVLRAGAPILVMQYDIYMQLTESPLTQAWIDAFEQNWSKTSNSLGKKGS